MLLCNLCQALDTSLCHTWSMRGPVTFTPVSGTLMLLKLYRKILRLMECLTAVRFTKETTDK